MPFTTRLVMSESVEASAMAHMAHMPPVPTSAGGILKAAREKSGMHLAVLSVNLKVSIKQLEALEADQYQALMEPVFCARLGRQNLSNFKNRRRHSVVPDAANDQWFKAIAFD
jgi:hypothetical protein